MPHPSSLWGAFYRYDGVVRVLHLVSSDRFTGAAAPALQLVQALRATGEEAEFAIRGGHNLQRKLAGLPWVHPILAKERTFADLLRAVTRVKTLAAQFQVVHCHLPHDHALARLALRSPGEKVLVRSVRRPRHLRRDPFHRWLFAHTAGVAFATPALGRRWDRWEPVRRRPTVVLPPAVEERFHRPGDRAGTRARLAIPPEAVVAGTVGKLHSTRGQDLFLRALLAAPGVWGVVVGQGEAGNDLARLAANLGVVSRVRFPGYVEEDLVDYYAAMDLFVFPAAGSDWGHRAIAEAMACGVPVLAANLEGVSDLVEVGLTGELYPAQDAAALAVLLRAWGGNPTRRAAAARAAAARASLWTAPNLAAAADQLYRACLPPPSAARS